MIIKVNGTQIKSPSTFKVGIFRLSKSGRLASGLMTMEIIAQKRRLDLTWEVISGSNLNAIIDILDSATFYSVEFPDPKINNFQNTLTMYVGDLNQELVKSVGDRVWKDVTISLIEQ